MELLHGCLQELDFAMKSGDSDKCAKVCSFPSTVGLPEEKSSGCHYWAVSINLHLLALGCQMLLQAPDTLPASGHGQPQVLCQGREDALRAAQCHAVQHHSPAPDQLVLREWECYTRPAAPQAPTAAPQPWPWHTPCSRAEHGSDRLFSRSRGLQTRRGCRDGAPGHAPAGTAGGSPSPAPCPGAGRARPHAAPA